MRMGMAADERSRAIASQSDQDSFGVVSDHLDRPGRPWQLSSLSHRVPE